MENTIYIGLSKQIALREKMDIIANNVANMSTPGYRAQNMVFDEYISDPRGQEDPLSFVLDYGQFQVTEPGSLTTTGSPLDVALEGRGFFGIVTPDGVQYSRAGNFSLNNNNEIITPSGFQVANAGGGPIALPEGVRQILIDENGNIATENGVLDQLMVVEFENDQVLEPAGNGLYRTDAAAVPSEETRVIQGSFEGSNVKPVLEMTRMIEVLREYQSVQRMMQSEHDRMRSAIQKLSGGSN